MKVTKEQIIRQSIQYFSIHDYERSSLNDIARALDITKGGIYHYFSSKDELFLHAILYTLDCMEKAFMPEDIGEISFKDILTQFFSMVNLPEFMAQITGLPALKEYENLIYMMFAGLKKFPEVRARIDGIYSTFRRVITELVICGQQSGEVKKDLDAEALAFEIIAFFEGAMLLNSVESSLDLHVLAPKVLNNILINIEP